VTDDGIRFTVMSYNVLSPKLADAHQYLYEESDPEALAWETRKNTFFAEIDFHKPDILCLQEVEASLFIPVYEKQFRRMGYVGVYKKRTRDKDDGCAIFFVESKFRLLDKLSVEFYQPHVPLLDRDNIALMIKLQSKQRRNPHNLIVGTTHLLFNPKRDASQIKSYLRSLFLIPFHFKILQFVEQFLFVEFGFVDLHE
jgi:protein angel